MEPTHDQGIGSPRVEVDLHCIRCGYNLRTLNFDALCPECGAAVESSLLNDPELSWLRKVRRGLTVLLITSLALAALALFRTGLHFASGMSGVPSIAFHQVMQFVGWGLGIAVLIGVFMVTRPAPRPGSPFIRALGMATRVFALAALLGSLFPASMGMVFGPGVGMSRFFQALALVTLATFLERLLIASYLWLLLAGWRVSLRGWWLVLMCLSGGTLAFSATSLYVQYQMISGSAGLLLLAPSMGAAKWIMISGTMTSIGTSIAFILFYYRCRSSVTRILAGWLQPGAGPSHAPAVSVQSAG